MKKANNKKQQALLGLDYHHEITLIQGSPYYSITLHLPGRSPVLYSTGQLTLRKKGYLIEWFDFAKGLHETYLNPKDWDIEE